MDFDFLKRVLAALEARGVRYAVFGAVALNLHGLARSTEDLDLFKPCPAPRRHGVDYPIRSSFMALPPRIACFSALLRKLALSTKSTPTGQSKG
jgi:hypothetical protein